MFDWREWMVNATGDHRSLASIGLADLLVPQVQGGPTADSPGTA
jgi:hypothetical protein